MIECFTHCCRDYGFHVYRLFVVTTDRGLCLTLHRVFSNYHQMAGHPWLR